MGRRRLKVKARRVAPHRLPFELHTRPIIYSLLPLKREYGFADVWSRGKFAWEYKGKGKCRNLTEAYRQLCQYREALENPQLLIVSDIARTEIHTNITGTASSNMSGR